MFQAASAGPLTVSSVLGPLAAQEPIRVDARGGDEADEDLTGYRDSPLVVQPRARRQAQRVGEIRRARNSKSLLSNLPHPVGKRQFER